MFVCHLLYIHCFLYFVTLMEKLIISWANFSMKGGMLTIWFSFGLEGYPSYNKHFLISKTTICTLFVEVHSNPIKTHISQWEWTIFYWIFSKTTCQRVQNLQNVEIFFFKKKHLSSYQELFFKRLFIHMGGGRYRWDPMYTLPGR